MSVSNCFICTEITRISLGTAHSLVTKQDGSVWACGGNNFGEFGAGSISDPITNFGEVFSDVANVIAAGGAHSMLLKQDGSVWFTGRNHYGQLGVGTNTNQHTFSKVIGGAAKAIAAGPKHSMVVREDDSVWNAGCNMYGQLADGSETDRNSFVRGLFLDHEERPVLLQLDSGVKAVAAGADHSLVLGRDGSLWAAGANLLGQLGIASISTKKPKVGSTDDATRAATKIFQQVPVSDAKAIAAGGYHTMVLKQDGTVWATGANDYGQLGDGSTNSSITMHLVSKDAKAVAAGSYHSVLLRQDGSVCATGSNDYGQLGDGSTVSRSSFVCIIRHGKAVAAGGWHSMMLRDDNKIMVTGKNGDGQHGDGSTIDKAQYSRLRPSDAGV